jgi:hypothetical protein
VAIPNKSILQSGWSNTMSRFTVTFSGFRSVKAFTGAANQDRQELQWQ